MCLLPCLAFRSLRTRNAVFSTAAAKIFNQFQFLFRETISYFFFSFVNVVVIINLRRGSLKPILADTTFFGFIKNQQQQQRTATTSTTATTTATTKKAHSHKLLGSKTHTHQRRKKNSNSANERENSRSTQKNDSHAQYLVDCSSIAENKKEIYQLNVGIRWLILCFFFFLALSVSQLVWLYARLSLQRETYT